MPGKVENKHEMLRAGYKFLGNGQCKSCPAHIEWWQTNNGKKIPFDPLPADEEATATPHWATCPNADDHRKPKENPAANKQPGFPERLEQIRNLSDARAIIAVWADGTGTSTVRQGLDPEDLRHDLITLTNQMRNNLLQRS